MIAPARTFCVPFPGSVCRIALAYVTWGAIFLRWGAIPRAIFSEKVKKDKISKIRKTDKFHVFNKLAGAWPNLMGSSFN